jgi:hypothetical protein
MAHAAGATVGGLSASTLLLLLVGVALLARQHRDRLAAVARRLVAARLGPVRPLAYAPRRPLFGTLTIAEVAFDYQRAVLELDDISDATKDRAIHLVQRMIVPLVGHVRLDDVTPELERGTLAVLTAQAPDDQRGPAVVWQDLLRWGRANCGRRPPTTSADGCRRISDID